MKDKEFIVINKKFLDQLNKSWERRCKAKGTFINNPHLHPAVKWFHNSLQEVVNACKKTLSVDLRDKEYYAVNRDEDYAFQIYNIISSNEDAKEKKDGKTKDE